MYYWWRHTKIRCQGPWRLSDCPIVRRGDTREEATQKMNEWAENQPDEIHTLADDPGEPQGPCDSEKKAKEAASIDRLRFGAKNTLVV